MRGGGSGDSSAASLAELSRAEAGEAFEGSGEVEGVDEAELPGGGFEGEVGVPEHFAGAFDALAEDVPDGREAEASGEEAREVGGFEADGFGEFGESDGAVEVGFDVLKGGFESLDFAHPLEALSRVADGLEGGQELEQQAGDVEGVLRVGVMEGAAEALQEGRDVG